jgi:hypothetical protein
MDNPECPQFAENRCPKSDVRMMAEHGTPQAPLYWSFYCRTCKYLFLKWNERMVAAAKPTSSTARRSRSHARGNESAGHRASSSPARLIRHAACC